LFYEGSLKPAIKFFVEDQKVVAYSIYSTFDYHIFLDYTLIFLSITSFHLSPGVRMKEQFKKIKEISYRAFNFILLLPVYFLGIGISHLLWRLSKNKTSKGWIKSLKLNRNIKKYEDTY
jgi:hypothetical protein